MARISGMILGIGLLIVLSSLASPAGAWDDDDDHFHRRLFDRDDDDDFKYYKHHGIHRGRGYGYGRGSIFAPLIVPRRSYYRAYPEPYYPQAPVQPYYPPDPQYGNIYPQAPAQPYYPPVPPQYTQPVQPQPVAPAPVPEVVPEPLPPEALSPTSFPAQPQLTVPPAPPADIPPAPPIQDRPGQFVEVAPVLYPYVRIKGAKEVPGYAVHRILAVRSPDPRIPGCVYVQVCVPPGPCRGIKVEKGGAEIELKYNHFEVEVTSANGLVTIEYDD